VYAVKGPGVHRLAAELTWSDHHQYIWDYWFVDADPVTIEIRFAERILYPGDAIRQLREDLAPAIIHEEGYEADRVFVRASLPPGRYLVGLWDIGRTEDPRERPPGLILDRGRSFRLMYWAPGGTPEVLGDYVLPGVPVRAVTWATRYEAYFATMPFEAGDLGVSVCLWYWRSGGQPTLRPLPGLWYTRSTEMLFPRPDDLVMQVYQSVLVVDRNLQLIATLVEDAQPYGTAVGPGGEVAVFLLQRNDQSGLDLHLTIFSETLETQEMVAVYPHGRFADAIPLVQPIWHGDEIQFLVLDDRQLDRPTYNLMAFDISTGKVERILGPFKDVRRVGPTHYILDDALFDAATRSLRSLPSLAELRLQERPFPAAANGEWIVFQWSRDRIRWSPELLAWHPADGVMPLGPGDRAFAMGEGFAWWMETPGTGD
jgi:hypothetical protein